MRKNSTKLDKVNFHKRHGSVVTMANRIDQDNALPDLLKKYRNEIFRNTEIQITEIQKYKIPIYKKENYRKTEKNLQVYRNTNLQIYRNTNYSNTEIQ